MATPAGILTGQFKAPRDPTNKIKHQLENKIGMLKNINYILEMNRIPCAQGNAWIIIKTAYEAAAPALLTLGVPGCTDIVKTKLGLSPWHRKGISALIKGATQPEVLAANKFLYKIGYFAAEKYLWWWMLADVTVEFVTTWQSLVYQENQCQLPGAGTAYGYLAPFVYSEEFPAHAVFVPQKGHPGVNLGGYKITIQPGYEATIGYQMGFTGHPDPSITSPVTTWWQEEGTDIKNDVSTIADPDGNTSLSAGGSWYYRDPGSITPKVYSVGVAVNGPNHMQLTSGAWNIGFTGRKQGNRSFGCSFPKAEWPFPNPLL